MGFGHKNFNTTRDICIMTDTNVLLKLYEERKSTIKQRLTDFSSVMNRSDKELFAEFVFCLLTPQSRAKTCDLAVKKLFESGVIFKGTVKEIERYLEGVRFPENKSKYVVEAREKFMKNGVFSIRIIIKSSYHPKQVREWLVQNVKGFGYKEASHFLRNIGMGEQLAILDKHILKNLHEFSIISEIPQSLTSKKYFEIEGKMMKFAKDINIPFAELDLLLWSKETGEIFK